MRFPARLLPLLLVAYTSAFVIRHASTAQSINPQLFLELEELARIVDISYCVGFTGIHRPFLCAGNCHDFPTFDLIEVQSWSSVASNMHSY